MEFEEFQIQELLKFLLYAAMPVLIFSAIGGAVALILIKFYKGKSKKKVDLSPDIATFMKNSKEIENLPEFFKRIQERERKRQQEKQK